MSPRTQLAVAAGLAIVASLVALSTLPAPFLWIGVVWGAYAFFIVRRVQQEALRLTAHTTAIVILTVTGVEAYLWIAQLPPSAVHLEHQPSPFANDSVLGWRLAPGQVTHAVATVGDALVYDVKYTVDPAGHRIGFPDSGGSSSPCVAFVVCSFTFGQGVADWETLPYRVGALTHGRVRAVNLGAPGYGIEHLLAGLERDQLRLPCAPTHVVYQALPHHVLRAAGLAEHSGLSPRYVLGPDGAVSYAGTAAQPGNAASPSGVRFELEYQLQKARLYRLLTKPRVVKGSLEDLRLYFAVVRRARDLFLARYPTAEFHVLAWSLHETYAGTYESFRDSLATIETVHEVRAILPDYETAPGRYELHRYDRHPNSVAYDLLARFVVDSIVRSRH